MMHSYKVIIRLKMLSSRLQQALLKRVQFIQNLLLIYSYSQILSLKIHQYEIENEQMYEKELIMVQTFRNIFRIDQSFRKFYYKTCINIFTRLHPKHKKTNTRNINRIHNVYFQFLLFFKGINELAIAKYLCDLKFETMSQNELFIQLTHTLIKYLKIKTQNLIEQLRGKCRVSKSSMQPEREDDEEYKKRIYQQIEKKDHLQKKRFNNFLRKSSITQNIAKRKYNSEEHSPKKYTQSFKKVNNEFSFFNQLDQSKEFEKGKGAMNIDWKIRIKKFQDYYSCEWEQLYRLTGLQQQIEQLKGKCRKADETSKKQWINENYRPLYQEMMSRNQQALQTLSFFNQSYHHRSG